MAGTGLECFFFFFNATCPVSEEKSAGVLVSPCVRDHSWS